MLRSGSGSVINIFSISALDENPGQLVFASSKGAIVAVLEDTFDNVTDTDDLIGLSFFKKGKEIMAKYDVEF